ncbi:MAG: ATP-binding protein [Gaiellaceae bacterium]
MSRIPLRLRLALAFALAMAVVLAVVGALLHVRLGDSLLEQVDDNLESVALGVPPDLGDTPLPVEEGFVQVIDGDGRVVSSPPLPGPAISELEQGRAAEGAYHVTRDSVSGVEGPLRLYVLRRAADGVPYVVVVGASLEDRQEALDALLAQLLVVLPLALIIASIGGYMVAGAALRPVETMRRGAAEISSEEADRRLSVPPANDEIRRLGETLNEMLERLEAGLARERRFVADASHELRTPLASLRTELELALRRPRSARELGDALRSAADEVERVVRLAEDLLVLARADEGRLPLDTSSHVVRELLDAVAGRFDAQATAAGRAIEVTAPDDWVVSGDRLRLEQALGNLVDNALRYGAGSIRLEALPAGDSVELRVSDGGPGFPLDFLPHAFERFSRADVARAESGAGLGLAIVEAVARAHGGSAATANLPGGGAAVTLRIPATRLPEAHLALI